MNVSETLIIPEGGSYRKTFLLTPQSPSLPFRRIVLQARASAEIVIALFSGIDCEVPVEVELAGEGADALLCGAYVCGDSEKVKIAVDVLHKVPLCTSRQMFKGIAGGKSRVDFYGKIVVAPDAQKTEAYQENHNLLLSDDAKVRTRPQLEIYADDVKCSHGATVGKLNEDEQFYMRSRGISLEDARLLQMVSFVSPVLEHIQDEEERATVAASLESSVRAL